MKVHKVTSDRIFFITDAGAYGSILKEDVGKLVEAIGLTEGKIDARTGSCMTDSKGTVMKVKIYGKPNCKWCESAKLLATGKGCDVEYINIVEAGIDGSKLSEICGEPICTVPQIFVDDAFIKGGYEGLNQLLNPKEDEAE